MIAPALISVLACLLLPGGMVCRAECTPFGQQVHPSTELKADSTGIMRVVPGRPIKGRRTTLDRPGTYCLSEDLWVDGSYQPWRWEGPTFFSDDEIVLELDSDDLVIDLQGHSVRSDARLLAAITTGAEMRALYATETKGHASWVRDLTIRNGVVHAIRGNRAVLLAGLEPLENIFSDLQEGYTIPAADASQAAENAKLDRDTWDIQIKGRLIQHAADYPVRNLRLEGLKIRSSMPTVVLQGANSVVRDSVIETDSGTALQIHGPNAVIENNTIIVHCRKSEARDIDSSQCLSVDAPIRLVNADGAVIRHNRIVLLGAAQKRVVSVFHSGAFVFEDNVITGLDDLTQIAKAYGGDVSMRQRGNQIDNSFVARFEAWFWVQSEIGRRQTMDIVLWVLQILAALLYGASGVMKVFLFDRISKGVPSFGALPRKAWAALGILELICTVGLIVPGALHWLPVLTVVAATVLAVESFVFIWVHLKYGETGPIVMSGMLGVLMAFVAYGRFVLKPIF